MRHTLVFAVATALLAAGCAPKTEKTVLKQGTAAYALAQELAAIMPALAPDKTTVLVEAKGATVTAADVIQAIQDNLGNRTEQFKAIDAGQLKSVMEQGAEQLAERKLLLAAAAKAKTAVPAEELDKALQSEYAQAGGEEAFLQALQSMGVSIDHVKKSVQETLLINKYLEAASAAGANVSEEDLRTAYAAGGTVSARHILLLTQGKTEQEKAEAKKRIEDILARAKAGEDFAELAKTYSEDSGSKDNGGLYEDFPRGRMVKPFEDAAFSVPVGEISGVVETAFGYHIIKVIDRKPETRPFEDVRGEIESRLKQERQGTSVEALIKELKDKAGFKTIAL